MTANRIDNVAQGLAARAADAPGRTAIVFPRGRRSVRLDFETLDALTDRIAWHLVETGVRPGDRALVLVRPGPDLVAGVFALLKVGAAPVLIDAGLPYRELVDCVRRAAPRVLLAVPVARALAVLLGSALAAAEIRMTVGGRAPWWDGVAPGRETVPRFPVAATDLDAQAAVAFTSGSTGPPKGVVYRHRQFAAQIAAMREAMQVEPGDVHLAAVPIFALFNPALGVTTVVPEMNPARPAALDAGRFTDAIDRFEVTMSVGSPTVWRRVADYCEQHGRRLGSLRRIYMFGAPAPVALVRRTAALLEDGEVSTPYGATEALPLTSIGHRALLDLAARHPAESHGVCVGPPLSGVEVRIAAVTDSPIEDWSAAQVLTTGERGEIVVRSPVVTEAYLADPAATDQAKIASPQGVWHRMGDIGYLDDAGRLWFCGRKGHRVETPDARLLTVPCEAVFDAHPLVARSALVGVGPRGAQRAVLIAMPVRWLGRGERKRLRDELLALATRNPDTRLIRTVLFRRRFPMDVRHAAKIQREKLAHWAGRQLG